MLAYFDANVKYLVYLSVRYNKAYMTPVRSPAFAGRQAWSQLKNKKKCSI